MFTIGLAVRRGVRRISVVGFDGYTSSGTQRELRCQVEFVQCVSLLETQYPDTTVKSLLKTNYPIGQESIYARLPTP